jgi:phage-related holin
MTYLMGDLSQGILAIIAILLVMDLLSGMFWGAISKTIWSKKSLGGVIKFGIYLFLLVLIRQLVIGCQHLGIGIVIIESTAYGLIMITEGISIMENLFKIKSYYELDIPILDHLMNVLVIAKNQMKKVKPEEKVEVKPQ